jgi:hypothetical protein
MDRVDPVYKFKDWVDTNKISWSVASANPKAIRMLERNPAKISWENLCENSNAIHILEKNMDRIQWHAFNRNENGNYIIERIAKTNATQSYYGYNVRHWSVVELIEKYPNYFKAVYLEMNTNPRAIQLLEMRPETIVWERLAGNPAAIKLLEQKVDALMNAGDSLEDEMAFWSGLHSNEKAAHLFEKYPEKINWRSVSYCSHLIHLAKANLDKILWDLLSGNKAAVPILEKNPDKIHWGCLSSNPNAIHLLAQNPDKINWYVLSKVPEAGPFLEQNLDKQHLFHWDAMAKYDHVYEIDYRYLEERCARFKEELLQKTINPARFEKYIAQGYDVEDIFNFF